MKRKNRLKIKITENDVKKQVKQYLSLKGYFHFHIMQGLGAYRGIPDIIAIKNNRVLFLEIKQAISSGYRRTWWGILSR